MKIIFNKQFICSNFNKIEPDIYEKEQISIIVMQKSEIKAPDNISEEMSKIALRFGFARYVKEAEPAKAEPTKVDPVKVEYETKVIKPKANKRKINKRKK